MTDYLKKIKTLLAEKAGTEPSEVSEESYFFDDLNIGEIEMMEIFSDLEDMFDITIDDEEKDEIETVGDLINLLIEYVE